MKYIVSRFEKCCCTPRIAPGTCGHPPQPTQDMSTPYETHEEGERKLQSFAIFVMSMTSTFEFRIREIPDDQPGPQSSPQWLEDLKAKPQSGIL